MSTTAPRTASAVAKAALTPGRHGAASLPNPFGPVPAPFAAPSPFARPVTGPAGNR